MDASVAAEIPAGAETIIENLGDLGLVSGDADFFLDDGGQGNALVKVEAMGSEAVF